MSPLSDGSDRSLASFSLGGGTWDPISSGATCNLRSLFSEAQCAFSVPSARAIYARPRRCERWGVQRGSRTVHNVTRHSSKHICSLVCGRSSRVHHLSAPRVSRSPSLLQSPLFPFPPAATRTGSTMRSVPQCQRVLGILPNGFHPYLNSPGPPVLLY